MSATVAEAGHLTATPRPARHRAACALDVLLASCDATRTDGSQIAPGTGPLLLTLERGAHLDEPAGIARALATGRRVVVAADPGSSITLSGRTLSVASRPIETSSPRNPLVADSHLDATVSTGPLAGATLKTRDFAAVDGGVAIARTAGGDAVVAMLDADATLDGASLAIIGSAHIVEDAWLASARTADVLAWLLTGAELPLGERIGATLVGAPVTIHAVPTTVHTSPSRFDLSLLPPATIPADPEFVRAAGHSTRLLPAEVHDALVDFADGPDPSGALLLRGVPLGELPATPDRPTAPVSKDRVSELVLLTVARRLGQPVGYLPEHGGDLIQNILPVKGTEARQVSTSSKVELMFHTEAAFHPHRPRFLLLLCLRGDPQAVTTLASIGEIVRMLPLGVRRTLFERRFRTAADESYVGKRPTQLGVAIPVLAGDWDRPNLVFDADLMVGIDEEADAALATLADAVESCHTGVALEAGDLLVVDNSVAVHGRSPFTPRFDGTDRWLQRTFVVSDLVPSAGERAGRIIATRFAG